MKKILFLAFALVAITTTIYASFPVTPDGTEIVNSTTTTPTSPDVDWTMFILCWFGGAIGLHRFYMGDTTNGILMLLTAGGCGIWALIDLIRILTGDLQSGKPGWF